MLTRANALAIMAKAPVPGTVKTRLVPPLTSEQAAELYRALLLDHLAHLKNLENAALYLAYAPDEEATIFRELGGGAYHYIAQKGEDLGERMKNVFADLWRFGHRNAVVIGSDLPALPLQILNDAFTRLSRRKTQVVLGPSEDGGYYLIGMKQPVPELFDNMTWSHERVLAETTDRLNALGRSYDLLPSWFDLDRVEDLRRLQGLRNSALAHSSPRTLAYLEQLNRLGCLDLGS